MKHFFTIFAILMAHQTLAFESLDATSNPDKFALLQTWYADGSIVTFQDTTDYFPGRCFVKEDKKKGMIFGAGLYRIQAPAGPGFPDLGRLRIGLDDVPEYFDARKDDSNSGDHMDWTKTSELKENPLAWTYDFEPNNRPDMEFSVVGYNDLLVVQVKNMIAQDLSKYYGLKGSYAADETIYMCYFFRSSK